MNTRIQIQMIYGPQKLKMCKRKYKINKQLQNNNNYSHFHLILICGSGKSNVCGFDTNIFSSFHFHPDINI